MRKAWLVAAFLVLFLSISALAGDPPRPSPYEALSSSGLNHYYSLEYDEAVRDFQKAADISPEDPKAWNHLLEAVLFRELYKYDALDTSLYTHQSFLSTKQVPADAVVKQRIRDLADKSIALADKQLKSNPQDVRALYARGVAKGLRSTYLALIEHSWFAAVRNSLSARSDHEQVLKLQPGFVDAKTIIGAHNFVVGSLPLAVKITIGITGIHGDKNKGLEYLDEAGKAGGESSADARVALALFLRREERFQDAINVVHTLVQEHPKNFLFALEEANLMKDAGKGPAAVAALRTLLEACKVGKYPQAHTELAQYALGEALRGQGQYQEAIPAYEASGHSNSINKELRQRSLVSAGEVYDILGKRNEAVNDYRAAEGLDSSTDEADRARKRLSKPYKGR